MSNTKFENAYPKMHDDRIIAIDGKEYWFSQVQINLILNTVKDLINEV